VQCDRRRAGGRRYGARRTPPLAAGNTRPPGRGGHLRPGRAGDHLRGSSGLTGVRNTMIRTTAARQPAATPSNFRLCSRAPRSTVRNRPLSKKKRTMLTELFTHPGYQTQRVPTREALSVTAEPLLPRVRVSPEAAGH